MLPTAHLHRKHISTALGVLCLIFGTSALAYSHYVSPPGALCGTQSPIPISTATRVSMGEVSPQSPMLPATPGPARIFSSTTQQP